MMTGRTRDAADDVRMRGFARRHTVEAAIELLDAQLHVLDVEVVPLQQAAGRVLAEKVVSGIDVPGFDRASHARLPRSQRFGIEAAFRLVDEQHMRTADDGPRQRDAALFAVRQLADVAIEHQ